MEWWWMVDSLDTEEGAYEQINALNTRFKEAGWDTGRDDCVGMCWAT